MLPHSTKLIKLNRINQIYLKTMQNFNQLTIKILKLKYHFWIGILIFLWTLNPIFDPNVKKYCKDEVLFSKCVSYSFHYNKIIYLK